MGHQPASVAVEGYLVTKGWDFKCNKDADFFEHIELYELLGVPVKEVYYLKIFTDIDIFVFYIVPEFDIFPHLFQSMSELIARLNVGIQIGSFELNFRDGKMGFKSAINYRGVQLSEALVAGTIEPALQSWRTYLPAVVEVIAGVATPVRAINKIDYGI